MDFKESCLFTLTQNNSHFVSLVQNFESRLDATINLMSRKEFLEFELSRIGTEYIVPRVKVINPPSNMKGSFSFDPYIKSSFDCVVRGYNFPIQNFINNAKQDWEEANSIFPNRTKYTYDRLQMDEQGFENNVLDCLKRGVALVMYRKYLKEELSKPDKQQCKNKLTAPAIRLFCAIVNDSAIVSRGDESAETFCEKVCQRYQLPYTENVRQYFTTGIKLKSNNRDLKKVKELIIPKISEPDKSRIIQYILNEVKLYG